MTAGKEKWEQSVRKELWEMAEDGYREFQSGLLPGNENPIIGVRLPALRKLAKKLAKEDWRGYLEEGQEDYYEEIMVKGLVIGAASMENEERFRWIQSFVPKIHNWAVCDGFCSSLKFTKKNMDEMWQWIRPYLESSEEYEIRFGVVMALQYFADKKYAREAFSCFDRITHTGYYVRMAVAWAISVYFVKATELTMEYLRNNQLDDWTYNKALQKILESFRVDPETKETIRSMKRKKGKEEGMI